MSVERDAFIDALYLARRGGSGLPELDESRLTDHRALELQLAVLDRFLADGEGLGGWKVGLTSGPARDRMGKDFRPFGYILERRILSSGTTIPLGSIWSCQIEPELCLVIGSRLMGGSVTRDEARAAVRAVAPAFEINERRAANRGDGLLVADGLAQWGVVVGPEIPPPEGLGDTTVEFYRDEQVIDITTPGDTMDDPYLALSRVCRSLHTYGLGLEPGQHVITGSFLHHAPQGPASYRASFSGIGSVSVSLV